MRNLASGDSEEELLVLVPRCYRRSAGDFCERHRRAVERVKSPRASSFGSSRGATRIGRARSLCRAFPRGVRSAMLCCSVGRRFARPRPSRTRDARFAGDPLSFVRARRSLGVDAHPPPRAWAHRADGMEPRRVPRRYHPDPRASPGGGVAHAPRRPRRPLRGGPPVRRRGRPRRRPRHPHPNREPLPADRRLPKDAPRGGVGSRWTRGAPLRRLPLGGRPRARLRRRPRRVRRSRGPRSA